MLLLWRQGRELGVIRSNPIVKTGGPKEEGRMMQFLLDRTRERYKAYENVRYQMAWKQLYPKSVAWLNCPENIITTLRHFSVCKIRQKPRSYFAWSVKELRNSRNVLTFQLIEGSSSYSRHSTARCHEPAEFSSWMLILFRQDIL
jgi:hypothetical protein